MTHCILTILRFKWVSYRQQLSFSFIHHRCLYRIGGNFLLPNILTPKSTAMAILTDCKRILTFSGLNSSTSTQIDQKFILQITIRITIYAVLITCILSGCVLCSKMFVDGPAAILMPIAILITWTSLTLTYTSLMLKTNNIADLIVYLENVIRKRNEKPQQIKTRIC